MKKIPFIKEEEKCYIIFPRRGYVAPHRIRLVSTHIYGHNLSLSPFSADFLDFPFTLLSIMAAGSNPTHPCTQNHKQLSNQNHFFCLAAFFVTHSTLHADLMSLRCKASLENHHPFHSSSPLSLFPLRPAISHLFDHVKMWL